MTSDAQLAGVAPAEARPLLGVAGSWGAAEVALARRFDALHQLVYRRGGIGSANAAVEEVAKLILIRLWALRTGQPQPVTVAEHRTAFAAALSDPRLVAHDPAGEPCSIWPRDEPFRISDLAVLDAASAIIADTIRHDHASVADPLGTAFDALLAGRYDHTGGLGTYLTPSGVARMMAEVALPLVDAAPAPGWPGFGDPYCGTGRFLVAALAALPADHPLRVAGPFGADQSASAVAKARINMLLYGVEHPLVWTVRDSVTDTQLSRMVGRIPLILANPPFGDGQYDDPDGVAATADALPGLGARQRIDPSLACLVRSIQLLAPGGVLGVILPDGVIGSDAVQQLVFDDGPAGSLASQTALAAAVSLPTSTFALSGTVAKTSALFLRRLAPVRRVALARVEHVGYVRQAGRAAVDPAGDELEQLPELIARSRAVVTESPPAATDVAGDLISRAPLVVSADAATLRGFDPARLDPTALRARRELLAGGGVEVRSMARSIPVTRARSVTSPFISVLHIDDLGTIDWLAADHHAPTTTGILAPPGALIVSLLNPSRLRAAVIPPERGEVQVSAEFGVFACDGDAHGVLALLYSPPVRAQLRPLGTGTSSSRRRIDADDVLSLIVARVADAELIELGRQVRLASVQIAAGRAALADLFTLPRD